MPDNHVIPFPVSRDDVDFDRQIMNLARIALEVAAALKSDNVSKLPQGLASLDDAIFQIKQLRHLPPGTDHQRHTSLLLKMSELIADARARLNIPDRHEPESL